MKQVFGFNMKSLKLNETTFRALLIRRTTCINLNQGAIYFKI